MNFCFISVGPAEKLIQLKDAKGDYLYPKVLGTSIPAGAVSKAQLGEDVTAILDGVATDTNLKGVQDKVTALEGSVNTLNGDKTVAGSVDKKVADAVSALVGTAPDTLNTLQKIAEEMQNPANNTATTVLDQVASKADSSALADEVTRAKAAEKANADAIAANTKSISDEVTRAKAAEKTNSDAITANSNAIAAINAKLLTPMITYEEVTA